MEPMGEKEFNNIINAFKAVHKEKESLEVSSNWQTNVMRTIRKNTIDQYQTAFFDIFQQFVWKIVPVSCALLLLLCFLMTQNSGLSDYEMAKLFINDPSDLSFISLYNG